MVNKQGLDEFWAIQEDVERRIREAKNQALEDAAQAVMQRDTENRGFIPGSLWDKIEREAVSRILALKDHS